ncbi:threonine transporter RhtB [Gammaproteobacteria bacterium 42_54_T18]|nr:threonine transporter RhtB [Gammaproteobacteria bacterium 42_54_T18]
MIIEFIFTFIIASSLISIAPGPDNIFVLTQSALYGRKSGVIVTFGLCTGLIVHTIAVALGVAAIFQASSLAFNILKFVGAAYLVYLAWQAFTAQPLDLHTSNGSSFSTKELYFRGIIMNITNPKVSIFFLAFLPQFTNPQEGNLVVQFFILGLIFIGVALVIFCGVAVLAGSLGSWLTSSPKNQVYLNRVAGAVFSVLALKLVTSTVSV